LILTELKSYLIQFTHTKQRGTVLNNLWGDTLPTLNTGPSFRSSFAKPLVAFSGWEIKPLSLTPGGLLGFFPPR